MPPGRSQRLMLRSSSWIHASCWISSDRRIDVLPNYAARASELLRLASRHRHRAAWSSFHRSSLTNGMRNVQKVTDENVRHLEKMEEQSSHFHDACQALGIALPFGRASYAQWGLAETLRDLSRTDPRPRDFVSTRMTRVGAGRSNGSSRCSLRHEEEWRSEGLRDHRRVSGGLPRAAERPVLRGKRVLLHFRIQQDYCEAGRAASLRT